MLRTTIASFAVLLSTATAGTITYDFSGEVTRLASYRPDLLPVVVGDPFYGSFSINLDAEPKLDRTGKHADWLGGMTDIDLHIGNHVLSPTGNAEFPSHVSMMDNFNSSGELLDGVVFRAPELQAEEWTVYRIDFILRDWSASLIDDLSATSAINVDFIEHDGVDHQRLLFVAFESGGDPTMIVEWQSFDQRLPGDANLDGWVTAIDLNELALNWRQNADWFGGDFTGDGFVDAADLNALALNWRSVQAVPEPSAIALAIAIAPLLLRRSLRSVR